MTKNRYKNFLSKYCTVHNQGDYLLVIGDHIEVGNKLSPSFLTSFRTIMTFKDNAPVNSMKPSLLSPALGR